MSHSTFSGFSASYKNQEQHGMCRAISYILQTLSAERAFNDKLTSPIKANLPSKWTCQGTAGDFMINVSISRYFYGCDSNPHIVDLYGYCDDFWSSKFTLSSLNYRIVQLSAILQTPVRCLLQQAVVTLSRVH